MAQTNNVRDGDSTRHIAAEFAAALAAKDRPGLLGLLRDDLDFRALTPGRAWEAASAEALVDEVILGAWFEPADHIDDLTQVETDRFADCERVGYRLQVSNPDGIFAIEQQAYLTVHDEQIGWLRILCSGYRPLTDRPRTMTT